MSFSEEQLCHLVADLFGAGLDTTLTTLKWALLYLATYPKVQDVIRSEFADLGKQNFFLHENDMPQTMVRFLNFFKLHHLSAGILLLTWVDYDHRGKNIYQIKFETQCALGIFNLNQKFHGHIFLLLGFTYM